MRLVRNYRPEDAPILAQVFQDSARAAGATDYTPKQVDSWVLPAADPQIWGERLAASHTFVAEENGEAIGFGELSEPGMLEMLYVRPDVLRQGVGLMLLQRLEARAKRLHLNKLLVKSSPTALPFFSAQGFAVVQKQIVLRKGAVLPTVLLEKPLE
ncbi:MAG: hypothetical protein A2516_05370 [Alphaproteobacteria bacterium RIFOXYD12_FULL_60_8]|nr:MAG: hypothetical protein A2516_05370 [Alphaproteobacteria bacterium RIFOXYD12_FULL_60_8]